MSFALLIKIETISRDHSNCPPEFDGRVLVQKAQTSGSGSHQFSVLKFMSDAAGVGSPYLLPLRNSLITPLPRDDLPCISIRVHSMIVPLASDRPT
jgi:hypothetical protein